MNFLRKITGSDLTSQYKGFESRVQKLPAAHQEAWDRITEYSWPHSDFSGRNLMATLEGVLCLLEETAAQGRNVQDVLGNDIQGFCSDLIGEEGSKSFRGRWHQQLNRRIARKLGRQEDK